MPERTGYAHGTPSWVDLATTDRDGAKRFYGELFGWSGEDVPAGDQPGTYTMFTKDGKVVAGMAELSAEQVASGIPPVWSTCIAVDDLDAALERVKTAGGGVVMPATDVMETGRMAFITDPTGAAVGLWQAGTHKGAGLVNEHGTFTWNELMTDDTDAARTFYVDVFGYRVESTDTPAGPYITFWAEGNVAGHAAAGMMAKPEAIRGYANYWGVYFAVDGCDAAASAAAQLGGTILPEVGCLAVVQDPQGSVLTVMEPARELV